MISRLRGEVVMRSPHGIVIDVGGVGYLVNPTASARRKAEPGGEVVLETYLHVREDVLQLFGFAEPAERELMELQEKLGAAGDAGEPTPLEPKPHLVARDALVELGYSLAEAEAALAGTDPEASPEERV